MEWDGASYLNMTIFSYVNLNFRNSTAISTPPPVPHKGFPGGSDSKESACNAGYPDSIPKSGRSPGEGNGNPFQYSCLGNSMNRGTWWALVHRVAESDTTDQLSLSNIS